MVWVDSLDNLAHSTFQLMLVKVITPSNAAIFPEYIIPSIEHLVRDPEVSVRCMYAQSMAPFADTALRYLEMGQALKAHGAFKLSADAQDYDETQVEVRLGLFPLYSTLYRNLQISYDASLQYLQESIEDQLSTLLVDHSPVVKRAVLHNISSLCIFLGRQKTNDVLLSHMITYMNHRDWLLRYAFFESVVDVAACVGGRSLEEYILPLMIQALSGKAGISEGFGLIHISSPPDVEESAVAKVLSSLTSLCELGLFQKMRLWELMGATLGFLYHPNIWIRQGKPSRHDCSSILHYLGFQVQPHSWPLRGNTFHPVMCGASYILPCDISSGQRLGR